MSETMKLQDLLSPDGILAGVAAGELTDLLRMLLDTLPPGDDPAPDVRAKLARDLAFGSAGEVIRVNADLIVVVAPRETEGTSMRLGVASAPFRVTGEGREKPATARALLLVLTSRRPSAVRDEVVPALTRWMREAGQGTALAEARTGAEVAGLPGLLELALEHTPRVETAMSPLKYRVYPSTPLGEVVDLMVRRELHAIPVVGEDYEVLGIITAGDALRDLLPRRRSAEEHAEGREADGMTARDVMTRTVMCVSEEQPLMDAAALMVNRDVEQLPVVRDGELIGLLTRDAVLRALFRR
jgi:CBS domain-containing protein